MAYYTMFGYVFKRINSSGETPEIFNALSRLDFNYTSLNTNPRMYSTSLPVGVGSAKEPWENIRQNVSGDTYDGIRFTWSRFSCRETILYTISETIKTVFPSSLYFNMIYSIMLEGIPSDRWGNILEFSARFFPSYMKIVRAEGNLYVNISTQGTGYMERLFVLSLFLYIFRHPGLVEKCLDNVSQRRGPSIYGYLCERFLMDLSYSDGANPGLFLSLFCFALEIGDTCFNRDIYENGPVNAANKLVSPPTVLKFVHSMILKNFPSRGAFITSFGDGSSSGVRTIIDELVRLYFRIQVLEGKEN